jgi:hypothetical protein
VEVSVLLRSVKKLQKECDKIEEGGSVEWEEGLCVRKCRPQGSILHSVEVKAAVKVEAAMLLIAFES